MRTFIQRPLTSLALALSCALPAALAMAETTATSAIDAQYERDRQACMAQPGSEVSRQACLREAGAARQAARRGNTPVDPSPAELQRNALARCEVHTNPVDHDACVRMVKGEGATQGSVQEGGVIRQTITVLDPDTPAPQQ
ncbi:MAG: hypothetical protein R3E56_20665 [Burkholderiaceae bacterium]